jgi:hypothetical protein
MKALVIFRKYPPPMIYNQYPDPYRSLEKMYQKMKIITQPQKIKKKNVIFCPIWIRKYI